MPPLFFFNPTIQAEWNAVRPEPAAFPDAYAAKVAKQLSGPAAAWTILPDLLADALTVLYGSRMVRRTAKAIPGLRSAAERLALDRADCRDLSDLLAMPEDELILVIHPKAGLGARVRTRGIATIHEFHVLLADALDSRFPGNKPSPEVLAAYSGLTLVDEELPIASARFQLLKPTAIQTDGLIPNGFDSSDHWLWGPEPLSAIPRMNGERVVILDKPTCDMKWEAERRFPFAPERVDVLEWLGREDVEQWIQQPEMLTTMKTARRAA